MDIRSSCLRSNILCRNKYLLKTKKCTITTVSPHLIDFVQNHRADTVRYIHKLQLPYNVIKMKLLTSLQILYSSTCPTYGCNERGDGGMSFPHITLIGEWAGTVPPTLG